MDKIAEVCDLAKLGTRTPAYVQIAPVPGENLLALIPCKRNAPKKFTLRWSADQKRATIRLRTVLTKADVALPGNGHVLELPVTAYQHPTRGWSLGIATHGETRPEIPRGQKPMAAQA